MKNKIIIISLFFININYLIWFLIVGKKNDFLFIFFLTFNNEKLNEKKFSGIELMVVEFEIDFVKFVVKFIGTRDMPHHEVLLLGDVAS